MTDDQRKDEKSRIEQLIGTTYSEALAAIQGERPNGPAATPAEVWEQTAHDLACDIVRAGQRDRAEAQKIEPGRADGFKPTGESMH